MSDTSPIPPGKLDIISAARYGTEGYPHKAWARLRREVLVCFFQVSGFQVQLCGICRNCRKKISKQRIH